jgi:GNAT superfamily N-acetyltransferase
MPNDIEERTLESAHFGIRIALARPSEPAAVADSLGAAREQAVDLLVCRVPLGALAAAQTVEANAGRLCDTLLYFERPYDNDPHLTNVDSLRVREAGAEDTASVIVIAERAFRDYVGHWHADSRIPRARADALYAAWARDICSGVTPGPHRVFVLEQDGRVAAFAAYRSEGPTAFDLTLGAVDPSSQGKGLYGVLVAAANAWLYQHAGLRRAQYSTHLGNVRTIRAVERVGYLLTHAVFTFHVWL